ncbi:MAG: hypothetical protein RMY35_018170 [Nostoc sp. DedSLP01]|nr:hypothetical protein [Nostoc sp. DedSLP05]MDZ8101555.1 hypothetical protein [Nostoc sp. DedSLP01]
MWKTHTQWEQNENCDRFVWSFAKAIAVLNDYIFKLFATNGFVTDLGKWYRLHPMPGSLSSPAPSPIAEDDRNVRAASDRRISQFVGI